MTLSFLQLIVLLAAALAVVLTAAAAGAILTWRLLRGLPPVPSLPVLGRISAPAVEKRERMIRVPSVKA
jgi:hypothetical protein